MKCRGAVRPLVVVVCISMLVLAGATSSLGASQESNGAGHDATLPTRCGLWRAVNSLYDLDAIVGFPTPEEAIDAMVTLSGEKLPAYRVVEAVGEPSVATLIDEDDRILGVAFLASPNDGGFVVHRLAICLEEVAR